MIGRQVITVNRPFTLPELEQFMLFHWDREEYGDFMIGKPTPASLEEYILLPATARFAVIVYARKAGGLLRKENTVILSVCDTPAGAKEKLLSAIPVRGAIAAIGRFARTMNSEEERKGPAEEILQKYSEYMKRLLTEAGFVK